MLRNLADFSTVAYKLVAYKKIRVSCNRCHYMISVIQFKEQKYHVTENGIFTDILSFDQEKYICNTCHTKLVKGNIPAQAV